MTQGMPLCVLGDLSVHPRDGQRRLKADQAPKSAQDKASEVMQQPNQSERAIPAPKAPRKAPEPRKKG